MAHTRGCRAWVPGVSAACAFGLTACAEDGLRDAFIANTPEAASLPPGYAVSDAHEMLSLRPVGEQMAYSLSGVDGKPLASIFVIVMGSAREADGYIESAPEAGTLAGFVGGGAKTIELATPAGLGDSGILCLTASGTACAPEDPTGIWVCVQAVERVLVGAVERGPTPETLPPEEHTLSLLEAGVAHARHVLDAHGR